MDRTASASAREVARRDRPLGAGWFPCRAPAADGYAPRGTSERALPNWLLRTSCRHRFALPLQDFTGHVALEKPLQRFLIALDCRHSLRCRDLGKTAGFAQEGLQLIIGK